MKNLGMDKPDKIISLQAVRALAFLGIFSYHCDVTQLGAWGVSLFFILSGFLMAYTYCNRNLDISIKSCIEFSIMKIKKLYLLHFLMMVAALVIVVGALISDFSVESVILYLGDTILNVLLLQTWVPFASVYYSLNSVAWYLSVCLFLYSCFPIILNYIKRFNYQKSITGAICVYIIQILIGAMTQFVNIPITPEWLTYVCPLFRLGDFIIGCCLGNIFLIKLMKSNFGTVSSTVFEIVIFISIFCTHYIYKNQIGIMGSDWFRYTMLFTPVSICIIILFAKKKGIISYLLTCRPLIYLGNMSPYTFLIHQIVIRYIDALSKIFIGYTLNRYIMLILAFVITIICSEIYIKIERRMMANTPTQVTTSDG